MASYGIGVIGMGWMGETHSRAFKQIPERFWKSGLDVRLVICADEDADRAEQSRQRFGFEDCSTDWHTVATHPGVDIVTIAVPNQLHRTVAEVVAAAGKHLLCEKPVGLSVEDTRAIAAAVVRASVQSCVGFNYRWAPLVQYARQLQQSGALGKLTHFRGRFFAMYGHNPLSQLSWRFERDKAGYGSLGDLMSHVLDMSNFLAGPVVRLCAMRHTFVPSRPLPVPGKGTHFTLGAPEDPAGPVTNEDFVAVLAEYASGARGVLEACRVMYGPKCEFAFDLHGDRGALRWDFERMNELEVYRPTDKNAIGREPDPHDGYARILAGPEHPDFAWFQPGAGISLGYDDLKALEAFHFVRNIHEGKPHAPSVHDALRVAEAQHAASQSWASGGWVDVPQIKANS